MMQYNNLRGIGHFRVSKNFVHHLTKKLKHFMERNNMKTQVVVLVRVCVACSLYKLAHCSELFVIKKSIVHLILQEFMCIMNFVLKNQMKWLEANDLIEVMQGCYFMSYKHEQVNMSREGPNFFINILPTWT